MSQHKLFIATPMYGGMCHGLYAKGLGELCLAAKEHGIPVQTKMVFQESVISSARNFLAEAFMELNATHLLFIDADIGFKAEDVLSLLSFSKEESPDVIAAVYPKKTIHWEGVQKAASKASLEALPEAGNFFSFNPIDKKKFSFKGNAPVEVADVGAGFMLIPRKAFELYKEKYPEREFSSYEGSKKSFAYFDCGIDKETNLYLAEDYFFCCLLRKLGARIWILPWIRLTHAGQHLFSGSLLDSAKLCR